MEFEWDLEFGIRFGMEWDVGFLGISTKDLNEDKQDENSQNDDEFVLSTRTTVSDSRANNPIDQINDIPSNRLILLESRNEITPSNSTSKMISAILDSRANSPFGHITSRTSRLRLTL
ncbi:hypothetical protein C1645_835633 [Glomus cerebriforme]|uniref:Uncharacterized protein n=1 Tax=Glomus cerebriforme TaxID=658196 RepID=A0A397SBM4_9GLOM|nr:hypothetical protein C1645_835633 [Glomus cerebriforme]